MRLITMTAVAALIAGCTMERPQATTGYDETTHSYWTSVLGAMDTVGGDRQTALCNPDEYGRILDVHRQCFEGHSKGMLQDFTAGGLAGAEQAAGFVGGAALWRPSNTNVSNSSTVSGGGSTIAPGAATAVASPVSTALGGAGGQGGAGGRGGRATGGSAAGGAGGNAIGGTANATGGVATGGNPTAIASPTVTASPVVSATASPRVNAAGGNGYGGNSAAISGSVSSSAASSVARQNQGQSNTNSNFNGQWNCRNSPPCN
jgi:hypothetical protein